MGLGFWFEFLGLIAFLLSIARVFSIFLAIVLVSVGVLWSPFAAFWCARVARGSGLSARSYAVRGGVYSALFLLPWVYLILRMTGKPGGRAVATCSYALLYAIWFIFVMLSSGLGVVYLPSEQPEHYRQTLFGFNWQWTLYLIDASVLALSAYLWVSSLRIVRRRGEEDHSYEGTRSDVPLSYRAYLRPLWYGIPNAAIVLLVDRLTTYVTFHSLFF